MQDQDEQNNNTKSVELKLAISEPKAISRKVLKNSLQYVMISKGRILGKLHWNFRKKEKENDFYNQEWAIQ